MTDCTQPKRIVIAGGGTGGHLFPGIAIAQAFQEADPAVEVLFVGTGRPLELKVVADAGFSHCSIRAEGLKGRGVVRQLAALFKLPQGVWQSMRILRQNRADLVIGVGGYSAGPVVVAAWLMGMKRVVCEQNILPGITNRMLAPLVQRIYVSFTETGQHIKSSKLRLTGNPVRRSILDTETVAAGWIPPSGDFTIVILGGSQGARSINQAVMAALPHGLGQRRLAFVHQTGLADADRVRAGYREEGISAVVSPFFQKMGPVYAAADLMVCRAGATTVAEITALGKAAILIPYPHAADNHQVLNAQVLVTARAARMLPESNLNGQQLATAILALVNDPQALATMAARARRLGHRDAARGIVDDCCRLMAA